MAFPNRTLLWGKSKVALFGMNHDINGEIYLFIYFCYESAFFLKSNDRKFKLCATF